MSDQQSSTTTVPAVETSDLKAGHAPAIKVGGMRVGVGRPRHTSQGDEKDKANGENDQAGSTDNANEGTGGTAEPTEESAGTMANRVAGEMVSGTFVPVQKAFPPEAVKHIHDKPGTHPKHEYHAHGRNENQTFINQPRKQ